MSYLSELGLNLTTVAQDYEKLGCDSVELLLPLIDNPDISKDEIPSNIVVPTRFVEGGTVVEPETAVEP